MKPERNFASARPLAQHCAELIDRCGASADPMPVLARALERFAEHLAERLATVSGDLPVRIACGPVEAVKAAALTSRIGAPAVHMILAPATGRALQLSFPGVPLLMLLDLAFGGRGTLPNPGADALPPSALVFAGTIEAMCAEALAAAFPHSGAFEGRRRDTALRRLETFVPEIQIALAELTLELGEAAPATIHVAVPVAGLATLCGIGLAARPAGPAGAADPAQAPFADIPLALGARLIDARLSAARIGALRPGAVLPLAVARRIPLRIGERVIAWGTVGTLDDCAAIQITDLA